MTKHIYVLSPSGCAYLMSCAVQRWFRGQEPTPGVDDIGRCWCRGSDRSAAAVQTLRASSLEGHPGWSLDRSVGTPSMSLFVHIAYANKWGKMVMA